MARTLQERIQRLEDVQAVRNIFSNHAYTNVTGDEYQRNFSHTRPDVRFEIERAGVTDGQEAMSRRGRGAPPPGAAAAGGPVQGGRGAGPGGPPQAVPGAPPQAGPGGPAQAGPGGAAAAPGGPARLPGRMSTHYQGGYVIEIAEDGKTAQATCLSPGHVTGAGTTFGRFAPMWSYCRYGIDFVREDDGRWKMWHEHIFTVFNSIYFTKSWVQRSIDRFLQPASGIDNIPRNASRNTSIDAPYAINAAPRLVPHPPLPYQTFSEMQAYVPPPAKQDL